METVYIVLEYSNHDGGRVRGVMLDGPAAKELASRLWTDQQQAFGVIADYVVEAWIPGQWESNSRGEREHVIFSANTEYNKRMELVQTWTQPIQP